MVNQVHHVHDELLWFPYESEYTCFDAEFTTVAS